MKNIKKISFKKIKEQLEKKRARIKELTKPLQDQIWELERACKSKGHKIIPRNPKIREELKTDKWASCGALCEACDKDFGWWCPKSPDHHCHCEGVRCGTCGKPVINSNQAMKSHNRMFERGNEMHAVFAKIEYNYDRCIFCGMPEERK